MKRFHSRRLCVIPVAFVLLGACSKSDAPPPVDSSATAAAAPAVQPLVGAPQAKVMPGALTKPIADYTGDELYAFVQALSFSGGQERDRRCKNSPGCTGAKRIKVQVEAVTTQDSIAASTASQFGVIYVRAINKGDAEESRYNLQPGNKFEYYMIVSANPTGGMQWRMEQLDTTPQARRHAQVASGTYVGCGHTWVPGAKADFKTCAQAASMRDSIARLGLLLQGVTDDPIWTACSEGCCVST